MTRCCICNQHPRDGLVALSTIVENSSYLTIAAIVEQVANIKVKQLHQSICNECWTKIQAAYSIQKEIRGSENLLAKQHEYDSEDSQPEHLEDESNVVVKQEYDLDGSEYACEYLVEYLDTNGTKDHTYGSQQEELDDSVEEMVKTAFNVERDFIIESCVMKEEPDDHLVGKVTRQFEMPREAAIVKNELHEHYRLVEVTGERCCGCSFVAKNRKELLQHSGTVHFVEIDDVGNYCPICFYKFSTDRQMDRHMQEFKSNTMYVCLQCNRFYNVRGKLYEHLMKCGDADGSEVSAESDLAVSDGNESEESEEYDFEQYCDEEQAESYDNAEDSSLIDDRPHSGTDPRKMHRYREQFEEVLSNEELSYELNEDGLNVQESQVATQRTFETFRTLMMEHGQISHPKEEEVSANDLCCALCGVQFPDETELVKHLSFFTSKQLFICIICQVSFLNTESLRHHQRYNERHRELQIEKFQQAGIEMIGTAVFVELEQADVITQLGKLLNEKVTYRTMGIRNIPMPEQRFIKNVQEYKNYSILSVVGESCCGCGKLFDTVAELKQHSQLSHYLPLESSGRSYGHQCEECFAVFDFERGLIMHRGARRVNKKTLYLCKLCGLLFSKKFCLARHMQSAPNHLSRLIVDASNDVKRSLVDPDRTVDPDACSEPNPIESDPRVLEALQLHRSVEEAGLEKVGHLVWYHCCFSKCKESFTEEGTLLEHAREEHNGQRRENEKERILHSNVCPTCCKAFQSRAKLMWHRFQRFVPKRYDCKQCDMTFDKWIKLNLHVHKEHENAPPSFVCPECNKSFWIRSHLKAHMRIHSNKKEYSCDVCGSSFLNKGLLKRHRRSLHSTELLFECKLCPKKFAVTEKLKIHQRVHTGERPYECPFCYRTFSHFTDRKRHEMAAHTGVRPFKCNICNASYIRNRELSIHMAKHKREKMPQDTQEQ